jgi:hypothetical protein
MKVVQLINKTEVVTCSAYSDLSGNRIAWSL